MPLHLDLENSSQREQVDHDAGPLEFGRGPQREAKRCQILNDLTVSRDQLRIEEMPGGRIRLENLSRHTWILVPGKCQIPELQSEELDLPLMLMMGETRLSIDLVPEGETRVKVDLPKEKETAVSFPPPRGLSSIPAPVRNAPVKTLGWDRGSTGNAAEQISRWLQRILELQRTGAGSPEFYAKTARALVDLIDMDLGLVLLRHDGAWSIAGSAAATSTISVRYSQTLLNHVVAERKTFYEDLGKLDLTASLLDIEAGVASPIFGLQDDVVGVLYGVRAQREIAGPSAIEPLEAQMVQLLAEAVEANLVRSAAQRTRVQFEQFFSPDLVRELERDANLLEGRMDEVTILCSDLRGFTPLSEKLVAARRANCFAT